MSPQKDQKSFVKFHAYLSKWKLMYLQPASDFLPFLSLFQVVYFFVRHLNVLQFFLLLSAAWVLSM